jgi:DNA-binding transcriptional ArsR family regulator
MPEVQVWELFLLGRKLMKLGEGAIPPSTLQDQMSEMATTARLVMVDVLHHPGSSVSEITERTGFPQSQVSLSVARMREVGIVVTEPDPADRRRTLVRPTEGVMARGIRHAAVSADQVIAGAIAAEAQDRLPEVLAALELLSELITPEIHGLAPSEPADSAL